MTWELSPSLAAARAEANRLAPTRSKISDGTIGDAAHASRTSDHNPGARNRVHALDLTHDPLGGWDAHARLEQLRVRQDARVSYLISNDRIAGPGSAAGGWAWHPYRPNDPTRNQHRHHGHISIHSTVAAETDTRLWWPASPPAPPNPLHRTDSVEVDVTLTEYELTITTDANGAGWDVVPFPRSRIKGFTPPGLRPAVDGRYLVGQVGFADDAQGCVVSVSEWDPNAKAVVTLTIVN